MENMDDVKQRVDTDIINRLVKENDELRMQLDETKKALRQMVETKPDITQIVGLANNNQRLMQENMALRTELNKSLQIIAISQSGNILERLIKIEEKIDKLSEKHFHQFQRI